MNLVKQAFVSLCISFLAGTGISHATERYVDSLATLQSAVQQASPGDVILVAPGNYAGSLNLTGQGTETDRITIRTADTGPVILDGVVSLRGAYLSLEGFDFGPDGRVIFAEGPGHRLWRCRFDNLKAGHWVLLEDAATHGEIAYCSFTNKDNSDKTKNQQIVQVKRSDATGPDFHHIHHNYFANISRGVTNNGFETIQLHQGRAGGRGSSHTVIEYNVFEHCDGEAEIISVKCSDNSIRYNLFLECRGGLVFRKGSGNQAIGNAFIGNGVSGTFGIRLQGPDHSILNNTMCGLSGSALILHNGDAEGYYAQVKNVVIMSNTIVDCNKALYVGSRHPSVDSNEKPVDVVFSNNILSSQSSPQISDPDNATLHWSMEGNHVSGAPLGIPEVSGFTWVDSHHDVMSGGIQGLRDVNPDIDQAEGDLPQISKDMLESPKPISGTAEWHLPNLPVCRERVGPDAAPSDQ